MNKERDLYPPIKKSEVVSVNSLKGDTTPSAPPMDNGNHSGSKLHDYINDRMGHLIEDGMTISDPKELIVRNYKEYLAVKAIRDKSKKEKLKNTQKLMSKINSLL